MIRAFCRINNLFLFSIAVFTFYSFKSIAGPSTVVRTQQNPNGSTTTFYSNGIKETSQPLPNTATEDFNAQEAAYADYLNNEAAASAGGSAARSMTAQPAAQPVATAQTPAPAASSSGNLTSLSNGGSAGATQSTGSGSAGSASTSSSGPQTQSTSDGPEFETSGQIGASAAAQATNVNLDKANSPSPKVSKMVCEFPKVNTVNSGISNGLLFPECNQLVGLDKSCFSVFGSVNKVCHTENNESITSSITMIQTLMSVAQGVTNACNNFSKAMNVAKQGMALYSAACGAAQAVCNSKCGGAFTSLQTYKAALSKAMTSITIVCENNYRAASALTEPARTTEIAKVNTECKSAQGELKTKFAEIEKEFVPEGPSIASKAKICKVDVGGLLMSAVINLASLAQSKQQGDHCKEDAQAKVDAENSCANPANKDRPDCIDPTRIAMDCSKPENADKTLCICRANPRTKGCETAQTSLASNNALGLGGRAGGGSGRTPSGGIGLGSDLAADGSGIGKDNLASKNDGTAGAAPVMGGAGGGLGSMGAGSDGGSGSDEKGKDANSLNANVLEGGGAGGGGGFRFGGSGYSSPEDRARLRAFANQNGLGKKMAGNAWSAQVTGGGGRSNFDKIKARYQENKPSLLLNGK